MTGKSCSSKENSETGSYKGSDFSMKRYIRSASDSSIRFDIKDGYGLNGRYLRLENGDEISLNDINGMSRGSNKKNLPITDDSMTEHFTDEFVVRGVGKKEYIVTREVTIYDRRDRNHRPFNMKFINVRESSGASGNSGKRITSSEDIMDLSFGILIRHNFGRGYGILRFDSERTANRWFNRLLEQNDEYTQGKALRAGELWEDVNTGDIDENGVWSRRPYDFGIALLNPNDAILFDEWGT